MTNSTEIAFQRGYRLTRILGFLILFAAGMRKLITTHLHDDFWLACVLLGVYLLLYATQPWLSRRFPRYQHIYLALVFLVITALGWLEPYEDTWVMLFFPLVVQIWRWYAGRVRLVLTVLISLTMFVSLMLTFDWWIGLGYSTFMFAVGYLLASADATYIQAEQSRLESERLLAELRAAHERLQEYTLQIEVIAAEQERNRMTRELHDAVSQLIFTISLLAESTHLLSEKNPGKIPAHLEKMQELTGHALGQMRALISQWRPG